MTIDERVRFRHWLDTVARGFDSLEFCELLGWFTLDQDIPLSPKEAGFD